MLIRRLLTAGGFLVLSIFIVLTSACSNASQSTNDGTSLPVSATLSNENVETLQKINAQTEEERLQALALALRENAEVKASLRTSEVKVQVLPDTLRIYDLYATVNMQLSGKNTSRVTYFLQPSNGQWLIAGLKKE
jgi:Na+-transporting methylmalonyl-CoA/oxaloacetate decarboxylase gamma subunit